MQRNLLLDFVLNKTTKFPKQDFSNPAVSKTNIVEHGQSSKPRKFTGKGSKLEPKKNMFKIKFGSSYHKARNRRRAMIVDIVGCDISCCP